MPANGRLPKILDAPSPPGFNPAMRNKRKLALAFLAIVLITGAAWLLVLSPREPSYQGKNLTQWLDEYNRAGSMDKTEPVSDAIRAMGTNSLPFLLANINHTDSPLKLKLQTLLRKQHVIKPSILGSDYKSVSILALSALGTNAEPLFPDLLKLADDPQNHWWGVMSLLAIGPSSIPTLEKVCENTNANVRTDAVLMIAFLKTMPAPWFSWGWNKDADGQVAFGLGYAVSRQRRRGNDQYVEGQPQSCRSSRQRRCHRPLHLRPIHQRGKICHSASDQSFD